MRLSNKVALITGGTSGIGAATAKLFAAEGAAVAVTGRDAARGQAVVAEISVAGGQARFLPCDVRDAGAVRQVVAGAHTAFGRLDILFNNAGTILRKNVLDLSEAEWDEQIAVNLTSAFLFSKYAIPHMIVQGSGVIINNGSGWGISGGKDAASYCASKAGLVNLTRAMALDHAAQGIRVNCICPGDADTPMMAHEAAQLGVSHASHLAGGAQRPLGRIGTAEEIARAVLFLASDDSSFMTGAVLVVDGGGTAG
ncbi:MAG: SDR family oxidoreductase [Chloroflexi bacterium]|nr:SDR family oxidoreductase [Chloroflexota bacterium]